MMIPRHVPLMTATAIALLGSLLPIGGFGQSNDISCLVDALADAKDSTTVGELRAMCQERRSADVTTVDAERIPVYERSAMDERIAIEQSAEDRPFLITAHQPNYLLWSTFDPNQAPFQNFTPPPVAEDTEMVFQISIKAPIWQNVLGSNIGAYVAYTTKSYWQLFTDDFSAPFRETNYQPEIFLRSYSKHEILGIDVVGWDLGFNHESNGRADPLSRSWNRVMGRVGLQVSDDLTLAARAWYRIPEDEVDDDNPREYRYYGYGDVRAIWTPNRNTFTALLRPGTQEFSYELTWSYPISSVFRVYALYYKGFGESLLDYDFENERFAIGIAMNDFLIRN